MGRPTDYSQEVVEKARAYLTQHEGVIPSIAGLAVCLGLSRETLYAWEKEDDKGEFSDILSELRARQEDSLINKGLTGDFNSTITKLLLTKHGYADRQSLEDPDGKPLPAPVTRIELVAAKNDNSEG